MAVTRQYKGAPHRGAPFALWYCLFPLLFLAQPSQGLAQPNCSIDRADSTATVSYVYDGDTVKLSDGRKLRFIGINTPEIDHDGGLSEPFASKARRRVEQLTAGGRIQLRYGNERHDRYGRLLGHPYLADGRSLNVLLLEEGLATTLVVPPNAWNHECYQEVERQARENGVGIWSHPSYQVVSPAELGVGGQGYRLVGAVLERVEESRNSIWLELEGPMALRVPRKDLANFAAMDFQTKVGRRVVARGWPHFHKGKWRMTVRHPAALEIR